MPPSESQGRGGQEAPSHLLLSHPKEETLANSPIAFAGCESPTLPWHEILVQTATLLELLGFFSFLAQVLNCPGLWLLLCVSLTQRS